MSKTEIRIHEFIAELEQGRDPRESGHILISCSIEQLAPHFLNSRKKTSGNNVKMVDAHEVTEDWLESNLRPSLFGQVSEYIFDFGKKLDVKKLNLILDYSDSNLVFLTLDKLPRKNISNLSYLSVKDINFWEASQLLNWFNRRLVSPLEQHLLSLIESTLPASFSSYSNLFDQLALFTSEELSEEVIKELIGQVETNRFDLADLINQKKLRPFYKNLIEIDSFTEIESICGFIIRHLLKIYKPDELRSKSRLSKYDQKIIQASERWSNLELSGEIGRLREIQILSRSKNKKAFMNIMKAL